MRFWEAEKEEILPSKDAQVAAPVSGCSSFQEIILIIANNIT
jgi:hypothetical protein